MKQKITVLLVGFLLTLGISSCVKDAAPALGDRGNTIIKFLDGPTKTIFYSPFTNVITESVFTLRRDPSTTADLQQPVEISLTDDATLLPSGYADLPATMFTYVADPSITITSGKVTAVRFAAGEISKTLKVLINGANWGLITNKYGKAYKISNAAGRQVSGVSGQLVATFAIKNQWDGVYEVTKGSMVDVTSPTNTHINDQLAIWGEPNMQFELRTISPTECVVYDNFIPAINYFGANLIAFKTATGWSAYGGFEVIIEFDPNTDNIVSVRNSYGQVSGGSKRSGRLDPSGINKYYKASRSMDIKYNLQQQANITPALAAPYVRTTWTESWTFLKDR